MKTPSYYFLLNLTLLSTIFSLLIINPSFGQHSVARKWNDVLLESIRKDLARPTVHARNLFHTSVAMYDAWAAYEDSVKTFFLGDTLGNYFCPFTCMGKPVDKKTAQEEALSYASFRILKHRFKNSPGATVSLKLIDSLFVALGHDSTYTSINYTSDSAAALGNYIAHNIIEFGKSDGSNEQNGYENKFYEPVNETLLPDYPGNPKMTNPNRWQPLSLDVYIDQGGNPQPGDTIPFLSPEWGSVVPFSLSNDDKKDYTRDGDTYSVYHDPGKPPFISLNDSTGTNDIYKWNFSMVSVWSSHLDPFDGVNWDISPGSIGNIPIDSFPTKLEDHPKFYKRIAGGDIGKGYTVNPKTGQPYQTQNVPRGDYARVLAEFWADGPDSETPPGHWFTLINDVNDHPEHENKWKGEGPILDDLEWDVKCYFILGGTMHDVAITAWGIKGWHDYIRPVSAIRYMADRGQCTDQNLSNYSPLGIPLEPGYVEVVEAGDPLEGASQEHVGKIKVKAWKGPDYITDPETDMAGVDWILAENWWPYQRPTFVTPPFAGFVSGHSTYSRAAAEVLTLINGDPYFPGGMGEYIAKKNEFLVFEEGPSVDVKLQWATYRDASDQCSLSRIWGGIHPPADDIDGRLIGEKIGISAFNFAENYFSPSNLHHKPDITICEGDSVLIFNTYCKLGGFYFDSLKNIYGCDSILVQKLNVDPIYSSELNPITICEGDSALIFGNYEKIENTYFNNLKTIKNCDSIISQKLIVKPNYNVPLADAEICEGDSTLIFGEYKKTAGTFTNELKSIYGCDSIITQKLIVHPVYSIKLSKVEICEGDSVLIFGNYQKTADTYFNNLKTIYGCDSIIEQELIVNPTYSVNLDKVEICEGDSVEIFGKYEKTAGLYHHSLQTKDGCDSLFSQELVVNPIYTQTLPKIEICNGDSALIFGKYEKSTGIYHNNLKTAKNCDSIITQELFVNPNYTTNLPKIQICHGDSVLIFGKYEKTTGTYVKKLSSTEGCDSVFVQALDVKPKYNIEFQAKKICEGDSLLIFGKYEKTTGTYYNHLKSIYGCDSTLVQKLEVHPQFFSSRSDTICAGDSVLLGGKYIKTAGIHRDTVVTPSGCDSITEIKLTVNFLPIVILKDFDVDTICKLDNPIPLPIAFPTGGVYIGSGVSGNLFDPGIATTGFQYLNYIYTDSNTCVNSDSASITVDDCIGIEDIKYALSGTKIMPNPNAGIFRVSFPTIIDESIIIEIFSTDSRLILSKKVAAGIKETEIILKDISKGIYYLQLSNGRDRVVKKMVRH